MCVRSVHCYIYLFFKKNETNRLHFKLKLKRNINVKMKALFEGKK